MRLLTAAIFTIGIAANVCLLSASQVTGSMTGTVEPAQGGDPLNIFDCPSQDCTGLAVHVSWSFDPSQFGPLQTGPGFSQGQGINMGSFSETINGVTKTVDSSAYFVYYAGTAPAQANDVYQIGAASAAEPIPAGSEGDYTLISIIPGGTFLNGLGPIQDLDGPASIQSFGALEITYITDAGDIGETIQFSVDNVDLNIPASAPEPGTLALMGTGLIMASLWWRRRRSQREENAEERKPENSPMMTMRNRKRIGLVTFPAVAAFYSISFCSSVWASSISVITSSGSQNSTGDNSFVNENINNGIPDPGNGSSGKEVAAASGSVSGNQFAESATGTSQLGGVTSGHVSASASLVNGTVHAYAETSNANFAGYSFNDSGYQSSARAHAGWSESLVFAPLPGQALGSLTPVTFTIYADGKYGNDSTLTGYTDFDFETDLPDIRDNTGAFQGSEIRWQYTEDSDGFGDTGVSRRFCVLDGNCFGAASNSGLDGWVTYAYDDVAGTMTALVQGWAVSGSPFEVNMALNVYANGDDTVMDFLNTGGLTIDSPVAFTSTSGVFLSEPYVASAAAPEPATLLYLLLGLAAGVWLRFGRDRRTAAGRAPRSS